MIMSANFLRKALCVMAAVPAMAMSANAGAQEPLKVGFVYVSPIGEAGWTWQQDTGRNEMEAALGNKVKTT
jgi:simple sugar transport system substrate-binding protein